MQLVGNVLDKRSYRQLTGRHIAGKDEANGNGKHNHHAIAENMPQLSHKLSSNWKRKREHSSVLFG